MDKRLKLADMNSSADDGQGEEHEVPDLLRWARVQHRQQKGGGGMVCVAPKLYLGNKQAAADRELLRSRGVVAVCAVGARHVFNDDIVYHHVSIEDDGSASMLPHFPAACSFIDAQRHRGAVLVHCKGGISRSPTMIIAYLMRHEGLSLAQAIEVCSLARPAARPRENFLNDLQEDETRRLAEMSDEMEVLREQRYWERALTFANVETVNRLGPRDVTRKLEVQTECRRLVPALQAKCIAEADMAEPEQREEPRAANEDLRKAAREAVTQYAKLHGWTKLL